MLTLPLLVFRVAAADYPGNTLAADHLAILANGLDAGTDFQTTLRESVDFGLSSLI
jgi:hypothetical protein